MYLRKWRAAAAVIGIVSITAVSRLYAMHDGDGPGGRGDPSDRMEAMHQKMYKELGITDEQKKLLEANKATHKAEMKATFEKKKALKEAMRAELGKPKLDMAKITEINNDMKKIENGMVDRRLECILEVRSILTPEQLQKFEAKMESRGGHGECEEKGPCKGAKRGEWKERREARAKVLSEAASALSATRPDLAQKLTEMAKPKPGKNGCDKCAECDVTPPQQPEKEAAAK